MKFKELEVFGFKSFADKLQVKFGGGITAIVGPNGCGKSNVADAIRWVLGEQSARLLRGKNMMDVIFTGTEKRKSLSYCEVMLRFDNRERMFPSLDYNEVTISRKLYRSGESIYSINNNECRLKDVVDLLHDGGMGREGYSIIGQGRIDELLSAKPENRRAIFEEAAGISKYKARKNESERKLIRTRENLIRIDDILGEKSRQLEPLSAQAEKARKCLDLRDRLKEHEINIYIHQRDNAEEIKRQINNRLNGVSEELDIKEAEFNNLMSEYKSARDRYESGDANIAALHEELTILNVGLEKQAGEITALRQRQEFLQENIVKIDEENKAYQDDVDELIHICSKRTKEKLDAENKLEQTNKEFEKNNEEYLASVDFLNESSDKAESERKAEIAAMDKLTEIKSNLSGLRAEKQLLSERKDITLEQIKTLKGGVKTAEQLFNQSSQETDALVKQDETESQRLQSATNESDNLLQSINQATEELANLNRNFYSFSSRYQLLKDMKESYEGFGLGVKNLLKNAKADRQLASKIEGVVAELIKVDKEYETAIEIALAGAYQNIVVKTEDDANHLIDYLKTNRYGRVTFLPMSAAKPRRLDAMYESLLKTKGCHGIASQLIKFDPKYKNVIDSYLGSTVIAENKEVATEIARKAKFSFKIVTLEGEVFAANGSITGGSLKADRSVANIFTHERELTQLKSDLKSLESDISKLKKEKTDNEQKQIKVADAVRLHTKNSHTLQLAIATQMETLNRHKSQRDELMQRLELAEKQFEADSMRFESIEKDLNSVAELEEFLAKKRVEASESGQEQSAMIQEAKDKIDKLRDVCSELRVDINRLQNTVARCDEEIERMSAEIEENNLKMSSNQLIKEKTQSEIARAESLILEISKRTTEKDSERVVEIRKKIANIDSEKRELAARITEIDNSRDIISENLQALRDKKTQYSFQLQGVDTDIEMKEQKLLEDYNLDYDNCLPFKVENYEVDKGIAEAAKLKRSIFNLGDVNIGAIEQCKTAYEEYHKYSADRDDLLKAEADLVKIIKGLSNDMLKLFNESFEKIRANFVKIFKELFDGGSADLMLTESDDGDPLSAGIEIVAQPPQKKLQSISLLSGGERALTAIAILFAILKLRPMPFCVLDEIEAALDDANAGRFAKYLRRFSEETQFIVITHRKPTMELSDSLYGVTMEEKGVSKIVSVKLSDAVAVSESVGA